MYSFLPGRPILKLRRRSYSSLSSNTRLPARRLLSVPHRSSFLSLHASPDSSIGRETACESQLTRQREARRVGAALIGSRLQQGPRVPLGDRPDFRVRKVARIPGISVARQRAFQQKLPARPGRASRTQLHAKGLTSEIVREHTDRVTRPELYRLLPERDRPDG